MLLITRISNGIGITIVVITHIHIYTHTHIHIQQHSIKSQKRVKTAKDALYLFYTPQHGDRFWPFFSCGFLQSPPFSSVDFSVSFSFFLILIFSIRNSWLSWFCLPFPPFLCFSLPNLLCQSRYSILRCDCM